MAKQLVSNIDEICQQNFQYYKIFNKYKDDNPDVKRQEILTRTRKQLFKSIPKVIATCFDSVPLLNKCQIKLTRTRINKNTVKTFPKTKKSLYKNRLRQRNVVYTYRDIDDNESWEENQSIALKEDKILPAIETSCTKESTGVESSERSILQLTKPVKRSTTEATKSYQTKRLKKEEIIPGITKDFFKIEKLKRNDFPEVKIMVFSDLQKELVKNNLKMIVTINSPNSSKDLANIKKWKTGKKQIATYIENFLTKDFVYSNSPKVEVRLSGFLQNELKRHQLKVILNFSSLNLLDDINKATKYNPEKSQLANYIENFLTNESNLVENELESYDTNISTTIIDNMQDPFYINNFDSIAPMHYLWANENGQWVLSKQPEDIYYYLTLHHQQLPLNSGTMQSIDDTQILNGVDSFMISTNIENNLVQYIGNNIDMPTLPIVAAQNNYWQMNPSCTQLSTCQRTSFSDSLLSRFMTTSSFLSNNIANYTTSPCLNNNSEIYNDIVDLSQMTSSLTQPNMTNAEMKQSPSIHTYSTSEPYMSFSVDAMADKFPTENSRDIDLSKFERGKENVEINKKVERGRDMPLLDDIDFEKDSNMANTTSIAPTKETCAFRDTIENNDGNNGAQPLNSSFLKGSSLCNVSPNKSNQRTHASDEIYNNSFFCNSAEQNQRSSDTLSNVDEQSLPLKADLQPSTISNNFKVCIYWMDSQFEKIGGEGEVVEIDEAKIGKRKYNRGRIVEGKWIFGGIERRTKRIFIVPVPDRTTGTLLEIIKNNILPGTIIISDKWRAYNTLESEGFRHLTVNHSQNFVDPETGAHTQNIERLWREVRANIPRFGTRDIHLKGYLSEYIFKRKINCEQRIRKFFSLVSELYPPNNY